MKKKPIFIGLLLLASIISNAQNFIKVQNGQKTHLFTTTISTIKQNAMGQEIELKSDVSMDIDVEVKTTTPDINLTHTIKRIQVKSEGMGQSMSFDSNKKDDRENQIGQLLSGVLDKGLEFQISNYGSIRDSKQANQSLDAAKNLLGDFDEINDEVLLAYPKTINTGDQWTNELYKDANNKSKIDYVAKSVVNDEVFLSFKGTIDKKQNKSIQGMDATVTASSMLNGELTLNIKTGLIKNKATEANAKGTTEIMGQYIPFTLMKLTKSSAL
jgi:Family of unknown function (DUF6263)